MVDRYAEITLHIEPARDGAHPVILQSRAGQGRGSFQTPFTEEEFPLKPAPGGRTREVHRLRRPGSLGPLETGDRLFRAFSGKIRSALESHLTVVGHRSGNGLRIKIRFAPCPELAAVRTLPWELLYWSDRRTFLVLNHRTSLVRSLSLPRPVSPLRIEPPLRILAVSATPTTMGLLDVQREKKALQQICEALPDVDVSFLDDATAPALLRHLKKTPFHVLHFMGHGGFDPETGIGSLLLADEHRGQQTARGQALAQILGTSPSLRLAVLNACHTARSGGQAELDPFAGVAHSLCLAGVPAVVAMQAPITDPAAITFSETFYAHLAAGDPVDTAVSTARLAIFADQLDLDGAEWATPVLFLEAASGRLFHPRGRLRGDSPRDSLKDYLQGLAGRLAQVSLPGFPPTDLEAIFVPLPCRRFDAFSTDEPEEKPGLMVIEGGLPGMLPAAGEEKKIVLLGEAGSGKTTLLHRLALRLARVGLDDGGRTGSTAVPILVRLADFARERRASPSLSLGAFLEDHLDAGAKLPRTLFGRLLDQGRAVVLLDGLDEVTDTAERSEAAREIDRFMELWPGLQVIVASRHAGYRSAPLGTGVAHWLLEPADPEAAVRLCAAWSRALARPGDPVEVTETDLAGALGLLGSPLAGNPRIATLLTSLLHRDPAPLLRRKNRLYRETVDLLVRDFCQRAGLEPAARETVLAALADLAARQQDDPAGAAVHRSGHLLRLSLPGGAEPATVLLGEEARASLLHPVLREYLAACSLAADPVQAPEKIAERIGQPRWREPLLLALGRLSEDLSAADLDDTLLALLSHDSREGSLLPRAAFLFAAALPEMEGTPQKAVEDAVSRLVTAGARLGKEGRAPLRWIGHALSRLATDGSPRAVDRALLAALTGEDKDRCLTAARLARAAGRRTAEIAAALVAVQAQDAGDLGWPIHLALRDLAHHRPGLLPAGPGTMRRALRKSPDLLHAFRLDPAWRRIGLALYGDADGPERMHRDSPLTPGLIAALESGHPARSLAPELCRLARSGDTPEERAGALLALAALGESVRDQLREDTPAARATLSSLSRLALELQEEIPRMVAPAFEALRASASSIPAERWSDLLDAVVEIAHSFGKRPLPLLDLEPFAPPEAKPRLLAQVWREAFAGGGSDPVYALAVLLDTAGEPLSSPPELLARSLALLPSAQENCEVLHAVLETLDGIDNRFDLARGWALARLAPLFGPAGLIPEALALALGGLTDRFGARSEAVRALLENESEIREDLLGSPDPGPVLLTAARALRDPFLRFRTLLRLARRFPALREEIHPPEPPLPGLRGRIARFLRPPSSELARAAVAITEPARRAWACDRLAELDSTARHAPTKSDGTRSPLDSPDLLAALAGIGNAQSGAALATFTLGAIVLQLQKDLRAPQTSSKEPEKPDLLLALEQLDSPCDRTRYRTALALHGDLAPGRRPLSARSLGPAVLERLARAWLDGRDRAPRRAQVAARALERIEHDDSPALAAWTARLARGGPGSREAETLLGSIEILHPAAWPAFLRGLREGSPAVQRALVRSLCRLLARDRLREEQWIDVAPLLRDLAPEAGEDFLLPDPPAAIVDAIRAAWEKAGRGQDSREIPDLAERAFSSRLRRLRDVFPGDPATARDTFTEAGRVRIVSRRAHRQIRAAADRVAAKPALMAPLLAWLCERLGRGAADSPFAPVDGDLLTTAAEAAGRLPSVYRAAAGTLPDLPRRLAEAVELHDTFPGRRAALLLLALLGRLTVDSFSAVCTGLFDVAEVQAAVLDSLDLYRETEKEVFPRLCEALEDPSALRAHAAGRLAAAISRSAALTREERDSLESALVRAATGAGAQREVSRLLAGPPLRIESAGRLAESFGEALASFTGVIDLLQTPGFTREERP